MTEHRVQKLRDLFRSTDNYAQIVEDILVATIKHNLSAPDLCVLSATFGYMGVVPMENSKTFKTQEALNETLALGQKLGQETFVTLQQRLKKLSS